MNFPKLSTADLISRLQPPSGKIRMVLDTDAYNEIDDQFAIAYALRSPERMTVEAIYAAPFFNNRSEGPADGMEKSYDEIFKILNMMHVPTEGFVFRGSTDYLKDLEHPQQSEAAKDLVRRAMEGGDEPLYVVAIGAITNVASAILIEPKIIEKIVVVWLGGNALHWPHTHEFNLQQDILSSRLIFDCGVPLIHVPCAGVTTHLHTTVPELQHYLKDKNELANYLIDIVAGYTDEPYGWSKVIWDIATIAWLVNPDWVPSNLIHSPVLTDQKTWSADQSRHLIRSAHYINRDPVFRDLFEKLS